MYRKVEDFLHDWKSASKGTVKALHAMTDETLDQAIVEGHSTLGWLGWHLAGAINYFGGLLSIPLPKLVSMEVPAYTSEIAKMYEERSQALESYVRENYTDEMLLEEVDVHGTQTPRGAVLRTLIDHQTHHRGQMTVLLRQAGLTVPGVMGPTREEMAAWKK